MVHYDPRAWWGLIFRFHRSDTFRKLLFAMLTVALFAGAVVYTNESLWTGRFKGTAMVHSLLGMVISLLLVFRTNTAYERWWEGRRQWGALMNASRNLAIKLHACLPANHREREPLAEAIGRYAEILRDHLRDRAEPPAGIRHWPNSEAAALFDRVEILRRQGEIADAPYLSLAAELTTLTDVCGACERIKRTPIPFSYSLFLKKFMFVYIVTLPFCFVHDFGYWTIPFNAFVFYVLTSLELIAEEIENPFGDDANDLPLDEIAEALHQNVREILIRS